MTVSIRPDLNFVNESLAAEATASQASATSTSPVRSLPESTSSSRRKRGRPSKFCPLVMDAIRTAVRVHGFTDSKAGRLAGIPKSTLSRWKQKRPEFAEDLSLARAQLLRDLLVKIHDARTPDGRPEWRAHAWLLE